MSCKTCKKKKANNITSLSSDIDPIRLKKAYTYVSVASKMTDEKWDYVESILHELYPMRHPLNRQCSDCLRQASKLIVHLYNKSKE